MALGSPQSGYLRAGNTDTFSVDAAACEVRHDSVPHVPAGSASRAATWPVLREQGTQRGLTKLQMPGCVALCVFPPDTRSLTDYA